VDSLGRLILEHPQPLRLLVVGPGALGCLLAAHFQKAKASVAFLARNEQRAASLRGEGVLFEGLSEETQLKCEAFEPSQLKGLAGDCFDLIFFCVKSTGCMQAAKDLAILSSEAPILVFQNGLRWPEELAQIFSRERIFGAMTHQAALRVSANRVKHKGVGPTQVAACEESEKGQRNVVALVEILKNHGLPAIAEASIGRMLWAKALVNAAINALTALLLVPNGALLESEAAMGLADQAAQEAWETARAAGYPLATSPEVWREVARRTKSNGSSTLQDVVAGRQTEIPGINGVIAERGRRLGVAVPVNGFLDTLMEAREQNYKFSQSLLTVNWSLPTDSEVEQRRRVDG
jgi:2-dehydropantoate 2-reductase